MKLKFLLLLVVSVLLMGCLDVSSTDSKQELYYINADNYDEINSMEKAHVVLLSEAFESMGSMAGYDVSDASISLNNKTLSKVSGDYIGDFIAPVPGTSVPLDISHNSFNVSETLIYPEAVNVTAPLLTNGDSFSNDNTSSITFNWDVLSPEPDNIEVFIGSLDNNTGDDFIVSLPGNSTTYELPAGTVKFFGGFSSKIIIRAVNKKSISGENIDSRSMYNIYNSKVLYISQP